MGVATTVAGLFVLACVFAMGAIIGENSAHEIDPTIVQECADADRILLRDKEYVCKYEGRSVVIPARPTTRGEGK